MSPGACSSRLSVNSEFVKPDMREILGFQFTDSVNLIFPLAGFLMSFSVSSILFDLSMMVWKVSIYKICFTLS